MRMLRRSFLVPVAVLSAFALTVPAQAAGLRCKGDPLVVLSNGKVLDLSVDIGAALWDVDSVEYTIHVPVGVRALVVVSTPNWPTTVEKFTLVSDSRAGYYTTTTVVRTSYRTDATAQLILNLSSAHKSGTSGQQLTASVTQTGLVGAAGL